jgi:hypothetical protein
MAKLSHRRQVGKLKHTENDAISICRSAIVPKQKIKIHHRPTFLSSTLNDCSVPRTNINSHDRHDGITDDKKLKSMIVQAQKVAGHWLNGRTHTHAQHTL